jgi:hypothetical protein
MGLIAAGYAVEPLSRVSGHLRFPERGSAAHTLNPGGSSSIGS